MSDEISRRPRSASEPAERYETRAKAPLLLRILAQLSVMIIFLAAGYYGADFFLRLLDRKELVKQENVVSNTTELKQLLASDASAETSLAPRKTLAVYPLGSDGLLKTSVNSIADVEEDELLDALKTLFHDTSESWANVLEPRHVYRDGVTAYLDLPRGFSSGLARLSEQRALLFLTGIVRTVIENFPHIKQVYFLEEGRWISPVGSLRLSDPWGFSQ